MHQVIEGRLSDVVERLRQMNAPETHVRAVLSDPTPSAPGSARPISDEEFHRILADAESDMVEAPNVDFSRASIYERAIASTLPRRLPAKHVPDIHA